MRTHGAVVGRRFRRATKLTTKVTLVRGYLWGSFLIAAAALKTPTRNGYNAQGVNLNFRGYPRSWNHRRPDRTLAHAQRILYNIAHINNTLQLTWPPLL